MSGIRRQISGDLAQSKSKGKAFVKEMAAALSPKSIASKNAAGKRKK